MPLSARLCCCHNLKRTAVALAAVFLFPSFAAAQSNDFGGYRPHYQGFGVKTKGGRGGTVYKVTNLNDRGAGSFRAAVTATGPRIVIFEVSGTISLRSLVDIKSPFLTIAGQTAPSPGITVRNSPILIDTHDVVIQHMRFRVGDANLTPDADNVWIRNGAYNIVLDHCSLSWSVDENVAINATSGAEPKNISILDSILSEALYDSLNSRGPHSRGILFMPNANGTATIARNLLAHNHERGPEVQPGWRVMWLNNLTFNPDSYRGFSFYVGGTSDGQPYTNTAGMIYEVVHAGNVGIAGADTAARSRTITVQTVAAGSAFWIEDNLGHGMSASNQWAGVGFFGGTTAAQVKLDSPPSWFTSFGFKVMPSQDVEAHVLANAGARPLDRDSVDTRVVAAVARRRGRITNSPLDVGGYPSLVQRKRTLTVPSGPNNVIDGVGRTQIERWLESFASELEPSRRELVGLARSSAPPPSDAPPPPSNLRILRE